MSLCPGFTKTEFHQRMESSVATASCGWSRSFLVKTALEDYDKGRVYSVPARSTRRSAP
jgi:hypothetical protein